MSLDDFLHDLHYDIDRVRPPDWEADWDDAPLGYKLYRGLPTVALSSELPLALPGRGSQSPPGLHEMGHVLWNVYGLTQFSQAIYHFEGEDEQDTSDIIQSFRRYVPSGGGLYPNEIYVYLKLEDTPAGIYHYDVAHHRLVQLREGNFDSFIARALGNRCDVSCCFGAVLVSTVFWKNYFKYCNLSYRLQGLDAGAVIGQLLEVSKRFGYNAGVYFQFLDRAVNHLLGLSEQEESVYAVIPLSVEPAGTWFNNAAEGGDEIITATELCRELPRVRHDNYVRSRNISPYPLLHKMNDASLLESSGDFRVIESNKSADIAGQEAELANMKGLPKVRELSYDLASASRMRYSPGPDFMIGKVSQANLAVLLQEAMNSFAYWNDLDRELEQVDFRVSLHGCLYNVEGIPDGAYRYDRAAHALLPVHPGDHRVRLQQGTPVDIVNLYQIPLCLHVTGDAGHLKQTFGYRGYRIQQMEAGMLMQYLLLAASAVGLGGHPLLAYDAGSCDKLYHLAPQGKTSLIEIPVGPYRHRSRLQGRLHG